MSDWSHENVRIAGRKGTPGKAEQEPKKVFKKVLKIFLKRARRPAWG
jgi:hypothetical protein